MTTTVKDLKDCLLVAADAAEDVGNGRLASVLRSFADCAHLNLEPLIFSAINKIRLSTGVQSTLDKIEDIVREHRTKDKTLHSLKIYIGSLFPYSSWFIEETTERYNRDLMYGLGTYVRAMAGKVEYGKHLPKFLRR